MRIFMAMAAAIGLSATVAGGAQAAGHVVFHSASSHAAVNHHVSRSFSPHFNYDKFGVKRLAFSHRVWIATHDCYLYWNPDALCWCFYVPTSDCYVPVQYFSSVIQAPTALPPIAVPPAPIPALIP
jgi:hypothetical protein